MLELFELPHTENFQKELENAKKNKIFVEVVVSKFLL